MGQSRGKNSLTTFPVNADLESARALFQGAGLGFPPVPEALAPWFRQSSPWCFSTLASPPWPYSFRQYLKEAHDPSTSNYLVLAHAGYGMRSLGISYYLVFNRLRILLQRMWGGVYLDHQKAADGVRQTFAILSARWPEFECCFGRPAAVGAGVVLLAHTDFWDEPIDLDSALSRLLQEG